VEFPQYSIRLEALGYLCDKGQIPLRYLVADRFEAGWKLVADVQRAEIWPII